MKKTWYYRTLWSYVPIFFIVTAYLFFVFFHTLSEQNKNNAIKANDYLAQQAIQFIDHSLKTIDQKATFEIMSNQDFAQFFAQKKDTDYYLNIQVMNAMQQFMVTNPLIDSVYLVRFQDQVVLSTATSYMLDRFPDASFIKQREHSSNSGWSDARTFREFSFEQKKNVVTLTRGVPIFTQEKGMMVINVKTNSIRGLVSQMHDTNVSFMNLFDRQGSNLFINVGDISSVHDRSRSSDLFAQYTSDYTGWNIHTGAEQGGMIDFILNLYNVWMICGIIVVIGGIGWIFYETKRNYRPIEAIISRIQSYSMKKSVFFSGGQSNEFKFIESAFENMIDRSIHLEQQHEEDLNVKRNYYLYELLEGTRQISLDDWSLEIAKFRMTESFGKKIVFVIEIDKYKEFCTQFNHRDQNLQKFVLGNVVQEIASNHHILTIWTAGNQFSGTIQLSEEDKLPLQVFESIRMWVENNLPFTVTIGIGEIAEDPADLHESYKEALEALNFKGVIGRNGLICYSETVPSKGEVYEQLKLIHSIVNAYQLAEHEWNHLYHQLFEQIRTNLLPRNEIINLMNLFIFHLNRAISSMATEFQELWKEQILSQLYDILDSFETVEEIELQYRALLVDYSINIQSLRESRNHHLLMEEVRTYIEQNFTNSEMSLDLLSDTFDMNGKHLSKLFKEEFGIKFIDLLIELRIKHAKKLLTETMCSIQEIAGKTGYINPISFNRIFKKMTGASPGDYRKEKTKR